MNVVECAECQIKAPNVCFQAHLERPRAPNYWVKARAQFDWPGLRPKQTSDIKLADIKLAARISSLRMSSLRREYQACGVAI
jgi:hypothetical protein